MATLDPFDPVVLGEAGIGEREVAIEELEDVLMEVKKYLNADSVAESPRSSVVPCMMYMM